MLQVRPPTSRFELGTELKTCPAKLHIPPILPTHLKQRIRDLP